MQRVGVRVTPIQPLYRGSGTVTIMTAASFPVFEIQRFKLFYLSV